MESLSPLFYSARADWLVNNYQWAWPISETLHFKMLFIALAGINVLVFYLTAFRQAERLGPGDDAPRAAKAIGAISLFLWVGVIFFGRMLGF